MVLALLVAFAAGTLAVVDSTSAERVSFRVAKLRARVVEMGELSSWDFHDAAYGVRLRATVCFEPDAKTVEAYPLEFEIAHFALYDGPEGSWGQPFRTVADDANWIVPFGETIDECGEVVLEDLLPDEDYKGMESELGVLTMPPALRDARDCYGVALKITTRFESDPPAVRDASGRAIVQCGGFGPN